MALLSVIPPFLCYSNSVKAPSISICNSVPPCSVIVPRLSSTINLRSNQFVVHSYKPPSIKPDLEQFVLPPFLCYSNSVKAPSISVWNSVPPSSVIVPRLSSSINLRSKQFVVQSYKPPSIKPDLIKFCFDEIKLLLSSFIASLVPKVLDLIKLIRSKITVVEVKSAIKWICTRAIPAILAFYTSYSTVVDICDDCPSKWNLVLELFKVGEQKNWKLLLIEIIKIMFTKKAGVTTKLLAAINELKHLIGGADLNNEKKHKKSSDGGNEDAVGGADLNNEKKQKKSSDGGNEDTVESVMRVDNLDLVEDAIVVMDINSLVPELVDEVEGDKPSDNCGRDSNEQ